MAWATEQTILLPRLRGISAAIVNINSASADTAMIVHKSDLLGDAIGVSVKVYEGQVLLLNKYSMNTGCMFNRFSMFSKTNGHTTHDLEHSIIHGCLATQDVGKPRVETTKYGINCQWLAANFYGMKHLTCIHTRTPHANTRTHIPAYKQAHTYAYTHTRTHTLPQTHAHTQTDHRAHMCTDKTHKHTKTFTIPHTHTPM